MLLLLDSHSSFSNFINIYTRPTFVPSLDTIRAKLRLLEGIIVFLEESIAAPILAHLQTQSVSLKNLHLYKV